MSLDATKSMYLNFVFVHVFFLKKSQVEAVYLYGTGRLELCIVARFVDSADFENFAFPSYLYNVQV